MNKITVKIGGRACGRCEAHICDTVRKNFPGVKKVSASRKRGEAVFLSQSDIDEVTLKKAITDMGYEFISVSSVPYKRKGLFGKR